MLHCLLLSLPVCTTVASALPPTDHSLQKDVPPALLVRFLREHRSEWADYNMDAYSAASLKPGSYLFPGLRPNRFLGNQIIIPLAHTVENEEFLEMIKLEGRTLDKDGDSLSQDAHLLQLCSGVDVNTNGACFQLVFAPVDELFTDALLLPSGFRIIPLDANSDGLASTHTLDLASSLEVTTTTNRACGGASMNTGLRSVLTIAFQFPYEVQLQDSTAMMARQHMHGIISAVQRISAEVSNPCLGLHVEKRLIPGISEAAALANWICQSYSFHMGVELLQSDGEAGGSLVKMLWHHRDALLCCSLKIKPGFTCANQAGHDMLETTLVGLRDITLDRIFDEPGQKTL